MRHRETVPVGRRASALAAAAAVACLTLAVAEPARAQDPKAPAPSAPAPKAPAEPPATKPPATKPAEPPAAKPAQPAAPKPVEAPAPKAAPPPASPAPTTAEEVEPPLEEPPPQPKAPPPGPPPTSPGATTAMPLWPDPAADASALDRQGTERPKPKASDAGPDDRVYAEDWWAHARPVFEIHGYFRLRTQLYHRFNLGRLDPLDSSMFPRPTDDYYIDTRPIAQNTSARLCTPEEAEVGTSDSPSAARFQCDKATQGGANIRFRVNPELHISDNLRILSQIDLLDNLVLGSTPGGTNYEPSSSGGGYQSAPRNGYASLGFMEDTQVPPASGRNSFKDSIAVKRAWAEYASPVGELRFGRMPFHWGLGMMFNAGDGPDDDYQSTVDRIQAVTGIKPLDLYFSAAWDFPNEGISSDAVALPNPEPYDLSQLDDVDQYAFSIARKKSPELERLSLAKGDFVLNGGVQLVYRQQTIADDRTGGGCAGSPALGCSIAGTGSGLMRYVRRDAEAWIPDLWVETRYGRFRFAVEAVTVQGVIENPDVTQQQPGDNDRFKIATWGVATELEQKLVDDKLSLGFKFGWASGDGDVDGLVPQGDPVAAQHGDRTFETFRFHPSYRVDLILNRSVLTRVQGSYYFRPNVDYDFVRDPNGQRIGGGVAAIWTRASQFIQAPGHDRDLGIELDGRVYYQAKDGALNDLPGILGGFFTEIAYGVLFPMDGIGYPPATAGRIAAARRNPEAADTRIAQTLRWYIGVVY
jgi:uncharacterized protein (TIGR04551 family)